MVQFSRSAALSSCAKRSGFPQGTTGLQGKGRETREGGYPHEVEACDAEEHASTSWVVGPAFSGDKWDKWWITRGLTRPEAVDNLWTGKLIDSMSCGEYKWSESCGGRRSGVASEWHCVGCSVG